jgi:hypothetical protein
MTGRYFYIPTVLAALQFAEAFWTTSGVHQHGLQAAKLARWQYKTFRTSDESMLCSAFRWGEIQEYTSRQEGAPDLSNLNYGMANQKYHPSKEIDAMLQNVAVDLKKRQALWHELRPWYGKAKATWSKTPYSAIEMRNLLDQFAAAFGLRDLRAATEHINDLVYCSREVLGFPAEDRMNASAELCYEAITFGKTFPDFHTPYHSSSTERVIRI